MMQGFIPSLDGRPFPHPVGKVVCVGRNYAAHAAELNNPVPETPLLFMKPATALAPLDQPLVLPKGAGAVHHELELAVLIGKPLRAVSGDEARGAIAGIGLGLDLTLREVQDELKRQGHPWERAKAFDGAYPLSGFVSPQQVDLQQLTLRLWRNGVLQQDGNTRDMLFPVAELVATISYHFTLLPGDIVSTGTPAGVGPLQRGDQLLAALDNLLRIETRVA